MGGYSEPANYGRRQRRSLSLAQLRKFTRSPEPGPLSRPERRVARSPRPRALDISLGSISCWSLLHASNAVMVLRSACQGLSGGSGPPGVVRYERCRVRPGLAFLYLERL